MCRHDEAREKALGIDGFIDELVVALVNTGIYWPDHPRVEAAIQELKRIHGEILALSKKSSLIIGVVDHYLIHEQRPLLGASLAAPRLIKPLSARGSGGIEFDADLSEEDLKILVKVLSAKTERSEDFRATNRQLESFGCKKIGLLPPFRAGGSESRMKRSSADDQPEDDVVLSEGLTRRLTRLPVQLYQGVVDCLQTATIRVCQGGRMDLQEVETVVEGMIKSVQTDTKSIMQVSRYERYDAFTFNHSIRVCTLALNFARTLTENSKTLNRVGLAALLHDVGKSRVPFEVLHHQGRLSDEQREEMEQHPVYGAEILLDHEGVDGSAVAAALDHHQTLPAGGYPKVCHDVVLSKITKIVKICDVYEALTAERPYKRAMSPCRAFGIMFSMKGHFESGILRRFVNVNGIYPTGSLVQLSNGMQTRVHGQSGDIRAPIVEMGFNEDSSATEEEDKLLLDLSRQDSQKPVTIQELVAEDLLETASA